MGKTNETIASGGNVLKGVLLMIIFALLGPMIDVFGKFAGQMIPAAEIAFARFFLQGLILLPVVIYRKALVRMVRKEAGLHVLRGCLMGIATTCFFAAVKYMPIADAIAIFFVEPMILTILSGVILRENVGWRRYVACIVGFMGAMLVIQPSFQEMGWVAIYPIGTAFSFAFYLLLTRTLVQRTDPFAMQFYTGVTGSAFMAIVLFIGLGTGSEIFDPVMPNMHYMWLLLGVGVTATISHLFIVFAFKNAPASILAPFQYLEIFSATILGYIFFNDFPNALKWVGIAIIIASGIFIFWRERRALKLTEEKT